MNVVKNQLEYKEKDKLLLNVLNANNSNACCSDLKTMIVISFYVTA